MNALAVSALSHKEPFYFGAGGGGYDGGEREGEVEMEGRILRGEGKVEGKKRGGGRGLDKEFEPFRCSLASRTLMPGLLYKHSAGLVILSISPRSLCFVCLLSAQ